MARRKGTSSTLVSEQGGDGQPLSILMSPGEVATLLNIPVSTLRYWSWSRNAPEGFPYPLKVGQVNRWRRASVLAWIERQAEALESGER